MEDEVVLAAILAAIADRGPASLEMLLDRVHPAARPAEIARAFQGARADRLIEAVPDETSNGDPVYRLTRSGRGAIQRDTTTSRIQPRDGSKISIEAVLGVIGEFAEASLGLVSWELCMTEDDLLPVWQLAFAEGLVEEAEFDAIHKEQMARLTSRGRERLTVVDEMTG